MDKNVELSEGLDKGLAGEVLFLGLLGEMIYTYPDPTTKTRKWFEFLLKQEVFSETPFGADREDVKQGLDLLNAWTIASRERAIEQVMLDLQTDNTQLFSCLGKILAPPWESVYFNRKRLVNQERMLEVRKWYRQFDLVVDKLYVESDDHIGLELVFVAQLARNALRAKENGNLEKYKELVFAQRGFLGEHLLLWGGIWCDQVIKYAKTDYYRGIAYAVKGALSELGDLFQIEVVVKVID